MPLRPSHRDTLVLRRSMYISEQTPFGASITRRGNEPPAAVSVHRWRYHHIGIPTNVPRPGERYLEPFKMYVSAFETSPCGIQWMRFEPDSPIHPLIKSVPHVAFEVDDLEAALRRKTDSYGAQLAFRRCSGSDDPRQWCPRRATPVPAAA